VDDLAYTLGVERCALNIVAAAKGLLAGSIDIKRKDGSVIDCTAVNEGILVPIARDVDCVDCCRSRWVLVVEKEATFRTLSTSQYWRTSLAGQGVLVTV